MITQRLADALKSALAHLDRAIEIAECNDPENAYVTDLARDDVRAALAAHEAEKAGAGNYRTALEDIVNPIAAMRRQLEPGCQLNGAMAVVLSESAEYLKQIAKDALAAAQPAAPEPQGDGISWAIRLLNECGHNSAAEHLRTEIAALRQPQPVEGGKCEKAVQDELPLATPVPPVDWKAVYANEATKFRAETIRTSELTAMVKRCVSVLIDDHPPGPWSRGCIRCKIVEDAEELLARPINVAAIPLYTAPQPPAIPEPSDEDVKAAAIALCPPDGWNDFVSPVKRRWERYVVEAYTALTTDRARLRAKLSLGERNE